MKSKKKLLLMGVGVMGALAMGVGAASTFAWYTAQSTANITALNTNTNKITTANGAEIAGTQLEIKVNWMSTIPAVNLTYGEAVTTEGQERDAGVVYVVDQNNSVVPATNNDLLDKSGLITFTLDGAIANMKKKVGSGEWTSGVTGTDLNGVSITTTYHVAVAASGNIRLANSLLGTSDTPSKKYVGGYEANQKIEVGTFVVGHVTNADVLTYTYTKASTGPSVSTAGGETPTAGYFGFYYSVTPLSNTAKEQTTGASPTDITAGADSAGNYGTITVYIGTSAF